MPCARKVDPSTEHQHQHSQVQSVRLDCGHNAADGEIWKTRRRVIVPSLHKAYIAAMIKMFGDCTLHATQV